MQKQHVTYREIADWAIGRDRVTLLRYESEDAAIMNKTEAYHSIGAVRLEDAMLLDIARSLRSIDKKLSRKCGKGWRLDYFIPGAPLSSWEEKPKPKKKARA